MVVAAAAGALAVAAAAVYVVAAVAAVAAVALVAVAAVPAADLTGGWADRGVVGAGQPDRPRSAPGMMPMAIARRRPQVCRGRVLSDGIISRHTLATQRVPAQEFTFSAPPGSVQQLLLLVRIPGSLSRSRRHVLLTVHH